MRVEFKLDTSAVERELRRLADQMPAAIVRALNRTIGGVQTVMKREIASDIGIKVGTVASKLKISNASTMRLQASITASGRRIPLIDIVTGKPPEPSRGRGRGVSYRLGGQTRTLPSAFVARMPSGHRGVFQRVAKPRLPIVELHGPSIVEVFKKKLPAGQKRAQEQLPKEIKSAITSLKRK